jgi:hypothetical protein
MIEVVSTDDYSSPYILNKMTIGSPIELVTTLGERL